MPASYSLITTCTKRWDFLARSLPSWLALPGCSNLFIVTYDFDIIPTEGLERVHLIVIQGEQRFHRTRALNLGAIVARKIDKAPFLMFTDADIIVRDGPLAVQHLGGGTTPDFVLDSRYALGARRQGLPVEQDPELRMRGVRGTHWVRSDLFFRVNGFNQFLMGWGFDDLELYSRYRQQSTRVAFYDRAALFHQPHEDAQRGELQKQTIDESLQRNKMLARRHSDPLGRSWAAHLGYPKYEVILPTAPKV